MDIKNNVYSNKRKNLRHKRKNLSQEEINPKEYLYNDYRNSYNLTDCNNATISEGFNVFRNKKKVKINNISYIQIMMKMLSLSIKYAILLKEIIHVQIEIGMIKKL